MYDNNKDKIIEKNIKRYKKNFECNPELLIIIEMYLIINTTIFIVLIKIKIMTMILIMKLTVKNIFIIMMIIKIILMK